MPNFFTVWAGVPSSQWGRTAWSVSQTPWSRMSRQFCMEDHVGPAHGNAPFFPLLWKIFYVP